MSRLSGRAVLVCLCLACAGLGALVGSRAIAEPGKDGKPGQPEMKLPPGWTQEDMNACMTAGMPGKMHEHLAKSVGTWQGKNTMWMGPGTEPIKSESTSTIKQVMDGRFTICEASGDMPGMGPFKGFGITGYDNVQKKYVSIWMDTMTTSMMTMSGTADASGKVITEEGEMPCCMTGKMTKFKAICRLESPSKHVFEMHSPDESGKMFKCLEVTYTRK